MRSRLSSLAALAFGVSVNAIESIFPEVRSRFCFGGSDRVYLSRSAIASIFPEVRSRFRIMYAIACIFSHVRSPFRIMYAIASIFSKVRSRLSSPKCETLMRRYANAPYPELEPQAQSIGLKL
jgi:hypothetical protein